MISCYAFCYILLQYWSCCKLFTHSLGFQCIYIYIYIYISNDLYVIYNLDKLSNFGNRHLRPYMVCKYGIKWYCTLCYDDIVHLFLYERYLQEGKLPEASFLPGFKHNNNPFLLHSFSFWGFIDTFFWYLFVVDQRLSMFSQCQ